MSSKNIKETLKLFEKLRLRYETPKSILHVALDLETTGLGKPSFIRITEVGAVALVQKKHAIRVEKSFGVSKER